MFEYFHVTKKTNYDSIMKRGLIPNIGDRSATANDEIGVYLFTSLEAMENALWNWLGEEFEEDEELIALKVRLNNKLADNGYEAICKSVIEPCFIEYFRDE